MNLNPFDRGEMGAEAKMTWSQLDLISPELNCV
jgi:hypothetical protein